MEGTTASNTIFTSSIVEAILQACNGAQAGTYDLITSPQWSWREVYAYYASQLGAQLVVQPSVEDERSSNSIVRSSLAYLRSSQALRERLMFFLAYLPAGFNHRVYARYLQSRALSEVNALRSSQKIQPSVPHWRAIQVHPMPGLADVHTLESRYPFRSAVTHFGSGMMHELR